MKALILVGGEGTRLRPLTYDIPKPLLPVAGVSIIERVLGHLASHGVTDAVLSMGYRPDAFVAAFPEDRAAGVHLSYAVEPEPLDTAGAIRYAAGWAGLDETFLVINGDVLTDLDVTALIDLHRSRGAEATIALSPVADPSAFGVVPTDAEGRVEAFIEKPAPGTAPTNLINAGTYVFEPRALDRIPEGRRVNVERETFPAIVADRMLYALASDGYWSDTGTPALYLQANQDWMRRPEPPTPRAAPADSPGVWREGSALVLGSVVGPALIGDAVYVASDASVSRSVVGAGCRVEAGAVVADAVLLPGAVVGKGAHVSGSIVGEAAAVNDDAVVTGLAVVGCRAEVPAGERIEGGRFPPPAG